MVRFVAALPQKGTFVHHGRWYTEFLAHVRRVRPSGPCRAECEPLCTRADAGVRDGRYRIPVLPETASEVLRLSQDPGANIDRIVGLIESEQAITARLLSMANSPLFRGNSAFRSGKEAVIRLGLRTVRDLVMQAVVMAKVFDVARFLPRMKELRAHATGVAFACRALETASRRKDDWAFMAGLLHDLGKPTLLSVIADDKSVDKVQPGAIEELLAIRHAVVGAVVAERMKLPEPIVRTIARHHEAESENDLLPALVASGDQLWRAAVDGDAESRARFVGSPGTVSLGIEPDRLERVFAQMVEAVPTCLAAAA
jgi:putative nucleotidyltransferase with HDIG domain